MSLTTGLTLALVGMVVVFLATVRELYRLHLFVLRSRGFREEHDARWRAGTAYIVLAEVRDAIRRGRRWTDEDERALRDAGEGLRETGVDPEKLESEARALFDARRAGGWVN